MVSFVTRQKSLKFNCFSFLLSVAGLGFGIMSGAFALINVLADSVGPGTLGIHGGYQGSLFFITSSITTLCFISLHTAWGVIFFHGLDYRNYLLVAIVPVTHLAASSLVLYFNLACYWVFSMSEYFIYRLSSMLERSIWAQYFQTLLYSRLLYGLHSMSLEVGWEGKFYQVRRTRGSHHWG